MKEKEDNSSAIKIRLEILTLIPKRPKKISSTEIYQKLTALGYQRTERSIQRALTDLCEQFDQLECDDRAKPYAYCWKEKSVGLNLPMLNEAQSLVLRLAQQQLKLLLPHNVMASMEGFFTQANENLAYDADKKAAKEWLKKVAVAPTSQPLIPAKCSMEIFDQISSALYHNKMLKITYRNQANETHEAWVKPLAFVQQGASNYLVAQYEGQSDYRHLALHRFLAAEASTLSFDRPADFSLKKHMDDQRFGFGQGNKIRLRFKIEKAAGFHLTETPLSEDQHIELQGDYYQVEATVVESAMLDWWLAKFGEQIQQIERLPFEE